MAAFVSTTPTPGKSGFIVNGTCADASACEELKAAVAGKSIIIDHITINNGAGGVQNISVGEGETVPGTPDTTLIGPMAMAVNTSLQWDFPDGMWLTAGKSLVVLSSSNKALAVFVRGRVMA